MYAQIGIPRKYATTAARQTVFRPFCRPPTPSSRADRASPRGGRRYNTSVRPIRTNTIYLLCIVLHAFRVFFVFERSIIITRE